MIRNAAMFGTLVCVLGFMVACAKHRVTSIDLQPWANQKIDEPFHNSSAGNTLEELPKPSLEAEDVRFAIGESIIHLGSQRFQDGPTSVTGIKVNRTLHRLYILHGTGYGAYGEEGGPMFVEDGAQIGEYRIRYSDKTEEKIPIVYGVDVRDWWNWDESKAVSRGKLVWEGQNPYSRRIKAENRVYSARWENPKPGTKVESIDFVSSMNTAAAPFCIAITAE